MPIFLEQPADILMFLRLDLFHVGRQLVSVLKIFNNTNEVFQTNASIIRDIFAEVAKTSPQAISCVVTNPVNSTVPVAAEALRRGGAFDPTRLFGITTLDVVRASTFIAQALGNGTDPKLFKVPVIGGHSGATILPLYSHSEPEVHIDEGRLAEVIHRTCA